MIAMKPNEVVYQHNLLQKCRKCYFVPTEVERIKKPFQNFTSGTVLY
jgi:hypothetical protein